MRSITDCSLVGVDGARGGWVAAGVRGWGAAVVEGFPSLSALREATLCATVVVIDMPMGLEEVARPGGRPCDRAARRRLGARGATLFSAPPRSVLECSEYHDALQICRQTSPDGVGLSLQTFYLLPKIRELDALVREQNQAGARWLEGHPELAFGAMTGAVIVEPKRGALGREVRRRALAEVGIQVPAVRTGYRVGAKEDDVLDALALVDTARRVAAGDAEALRGEPRHDRYGLEMAIWC